MKSWLRSFNIYFYLLAALAVVSGGCSSSGLSMRKEYSTLRVYMEGAPRESPMVYVTRARTLMYIKPEPILTEEDVQKATLADNPDGTFEIQVTFNDHGSLVLDMQTTSNRGKHLIIFSHFPPKGWKEPKDSGTDSAEPPKPGEPRISGWLAAPLIQTGFSNGSLKFTPDASHEEADRIVRGLNNMARDLAK
jgi:hypothetical protein